MESKLPKPSGLKRPTPVFKNILPTDRIKPSGLGGKANGANATALGSFPPLSRDLTNLQLNGKFKAERAGSPDIDRPKLSPGRRKLRRSRSACDINELKRPCKRPEPTLAPIPSKSARFNLTTTAGGGVGRTISTTRRPIPTTRPAMQRAGSAPRSTASSSSSSSTSASTGATSGGGGGGGGGGAVKKTTSASNKSASVSTTGAGKTINKRIPPYDYKARYNDLLERTKAVKSELEDKTEQLRNLESLVEQFEDLQSENISFKDQLKNSQTENECLHRQVSSQTLKIDTLTATLTETKTEFEKLRQDHEVMSKEHTALREEVIELRERTQFLSERNEHLVEEIAACRDQLFNSNIERKELHNVIMDLRGNIRVFCRVRPPLQCESEKLLCHWNYLDESSLEITNPDLMGKNKPISHSFNFDQVFHPGTTQLEIFEMVSPLIQSALDGYNVCIFAYGQTGSGKTYTMDGVPDNVGVIPRTVDLLFDSIKNYKRLGWEYEIKVTFLEIYNEVLYDLLSNEPKDMEIRMVKNSKNDIYVSNITEETVTCATRLRQLMQIAKMNRATAATVGNDRSSRSHAVTKLELIGRHEDKNEVSIGSINLVDLAGSESPKTSTRMNETKNINRSLSELTNVILALLQRQDHIPYRNSKLTHLLMPSLGGNSKTLMFINVAPFQDCFVESVKSLRFAASVNSCKMAKAKRNRFLNTSSSSGSIEK